MLTYYPSIAEEDAEDDEEISGDNLAHYNKLIMPTVVISLDATDEFLKERVMNLPQAVVEGTHNTEKGVSSIMKIIIIAITTHTVQILLDDCHCSDLRIRMTPLFLTILMNWKFILNILVSACVNASAGTLAASPLAYRW